VHLFGACPELGNRFQPRGLAQLGQGWMLKGYGPCDAPMGSAEADHQRAAHLVQRVRASGLDTAVLLAMDAPCDDAGQPIPSRTLLKVGNDFAREIAASDPARLRFGASVHPYRPDAVPRLEALIDGGAALVKWLPSYHGIALDDPRCVAVYELLAQRGVPLLVHCGIEHTLAGGPQRLNHPDHLVTPLERGVTVIAAHCGLRLSYLEPCWGGAWARLAMEHERCFGDIAACFNPVRLWQLARWLDRPELSAKLVYGSDFPARPVWAWWSPRVSMATAGEPDLLQACLGIARAVGVPEDTLTRAGRLLPPRVLEDAAS
jgi:uncharacterized protein